MVEITVNLQRVDHILCTAEHFPGNDGIIKNGLPFSSPQSFIPYYYALVHVFFQDLFDLGRDLTLFCSSIFAFQGFQLFGKTLFFYFAL